MEKRLHLALNRTIPDNYAFVDLDSNLVLNLSQPVGYADRLTQSIIRGLNGKRLVDLNGVATVALKEYMEKNGISKARSRKVGTYTQAQRIQQITEAQEKVLDEKTEGTDGGKSEVINEDKVEDVVDKAEEETTNADATTPAEETTAEVVEETTEAVTEDAVDSEAYSKESLEAMEYGQLKELANSHGISERKKETIIEKLLEL